MMHRRAITVARLACRSRRGDGLARACGPYDAASVRHPARQHGSCRACMPPLANTASSTRAPMRTALHKHHR